MTVACFSIKFPVALHLQQNKSSTTASLSRQSLGGFGQHCGLHLVSSRSATCPLTSPTSVRSCTSFSKSKKLRPVRCASEVVRRSPTAGSQLLVFVPPHPLIKHWVALLRNESTPSPLFKSAMAELGRILIYEACRDWLPTVSGQIQTPMGVADVEFLDTQQPFKVVPILRAGLALAEHVSSIIPHAVILHIGYARDETTLLPTLYLNKLPEKFEDGERVLIVDPMLATGGTIMAAMEEITSRGADMSSIRIVSAVAAPPALKKLNEKYKRLRVYTGIIDSEVNEKGFIVPGLGDAGDRSYGT
eukprot:TRINITY_DN5929_c0_g1_i2.p1 TRINITY_DN5929_c0_g1~~TRINITY_DN5929_c0_g1_i2.p1  ORF type:complete len:303 (+),score=52.06 TRINITY_DN5929_c0_g1_i2:142-1050(+)